jgi:hypothetical protein
MDYKEKAFYDHLERGIVLYLVKVSLYLKHPLNNGEISIIIITHLVNAARRESIPGLLSTRKLCSPRPFLTGEPARHLVQPQ